jgi:hypothetical protein
MALKQTVTTVHGFEAIDAYHRVENIVMVGKDKIKFYVRSYKEPGLPAFNDQPMECAYSIDGDNPIKQAYLHIKTTDEFSAAKDC